MGEMFHRVHIHLTISALTLLCACPALAQASGPVPGDPSVTSAPGIAAPVPGQSSGMMPGALPGGPVPGPSYGAPIGSPLPAQPTTATPPSPVVVAPVHVPSAYQQLPTSANDAESRIAELRCLLPVSRAKELQDPIYQLCEWLDDMVAAHRKLANSFAKHESTKMQLEAERRALEKFRHLKNEATLLKADLLIQQQRYPEALAPLIEIVSSEPGTATGQAAYRRLKDIGFAEEVGSALKSSAPPATPPAAKTPAPARPAVYAPSPRPRPEPVRRQTSPPVTAKHAAPTRPRPAKPLTYRVLSAQSGPLWLTGSPSGAPVKSANRTLAGAPRH